MHFGMKMLETLANLFYDPYVYWGLPLLIALGLQIAGRLRGRKNARE